MTEPLVSIIIPAYNSGKYIGECLESVINQTYKNWEAIIVLAPSTDNTLDVIQKYSSRDFHIINEEKKTNCATGRNTGISKSRGEYIAMLDADDWWEPNKLLEMVSCMKDNPTLEWCTHYVDVQFSDHIELITGYPGKTPWVAGTAYAMFRRDFLEDIQQKWGHIFNEKMNRADDMDLMLRIRNDPFITIPKALSHWRYHSEGLTSGTPILTQYREIILMTWRNRAYCLMLYYLKGYCQEVFKRPHGML